ncbi:hypothetical protein QVD17_09311 [Tagetes erecta]|uniref:Uncharacterized protein n=1 Tax=Tagetes erecta TaxID=13708 RepID=A0AAD8L735_TARER|nr:hypothetical protein QVD17_09311 [Tagetes erecta]
MLEKILGVVVAFMDSKSGTDRVYLIDNEVNIQTDHNQWLLRSLLMRIGRRFAMMLKTTQLNVHQIFSVMEFQHFILFIELDAREDSAL